MLFSKNILAELKLIIDQRIFRLDKIHFVLSFT